VVTQHRLDAHLATVRHLHCQRHCFSGSWKNFRLSILKFGNCVLRIQSERYVCDDTNYLFGPLCCGLVFGETNCRRVAATSESRGGIGITNIVRYHLNCCKLMFNCLFQEVGQWQKGTERISVTAQKFDLFIQVLHVFLQHNTIFLFLWIIIHS